MLPRQKISNIGLYCNKSVISEHYFFASVTKIHLCFNHRCVHSVKRLVVANNQWPENVIKLCSRNNLFIRILANENFFWGERWGGG